MRHSLVLAIAGFVAVSAPPAFADLLKFDFEGHGDLIPITNDYAGLVFSNAATIVTGAAGGSGNEGEFPPRSGVTVAFNTGAPMSIKFSAPILNFSGYFNYNAALTLKAFSGSNALVDTENSSFGSNLALSGELGSAPNELVSLASAGGISRVEISIDDFIDLNGSAGPGTFTLDDLSITTPDITSVPEVSSVVLLATIAGLVFLLQRSRHAVD